LIDRLQLAFSRDPFVLFTRALAPILGFRGAQWYQRLELRDDVLIRRWEFRRSEEYRLSDLILVHGFAGLVGI
jgi:hypothetical protein